MSKNKPWDDVLADFGMATDRLGEVLSRYQDSNDDIVLDALIQRFKDYKLRLSGVV